MIQKPAVSLIAFLFVWVQLFDLAISSSFTSESTGDDKTGDDKHHDSPEVGLQPEEVELPQDGHLSGYLSDDYWSDSSSSRCTCDKSTACANVHDPENSISSCGARVFYMVGIHNNRTLHDALYLFRGIRDPRNTIVIHIDKKFGMDAFYGSQLHEEIEACPCGSNVEVASLYDCKWGQWSMNLPTYWGMEKAVKEYAGKWDVFMNLSGDTLPVYTANRVAALFAGPLRGINFISSSACETGLTPTPIDYFPKTWHKRGHYSKNPMNLTYVDSEGQEHNNVHMTIYFGSQWMSLLPEWCTYLVEEMARPDSLPSRFKQYLKDTKKMMSDETYIPTLLMHLHPETTPKLREDSSLDVDWDHKMYDIRYERMDEHYPNSHGDFPVDQRYEPPEGTGVGKTRPWGPYYLGVYDLADIRVAGALFIRKVATAIDYNMYHLLPVDHPSEIPMIGWPKILQFSDKPNWEGKLAEIKKKKKQQDEEKKKQEEANETKKQEKQASGKQDPGLKGATKTS